jgi:PAS domain S-box-containing protein
MSDDDSQSSSGSSAEDKSRDVVLLHESDELLELAQEAGRLGIFQWQITNDEVWLSPKFLSLYGLTEFDGRYATWRECVFREDRIRIDNLIETAFADRERELHLEFRIHHGGDGATRWIEARNIVFYDPDGRATRMVGVNVDVTERKRAIMQLHAFTETLEDRVRERTRELEAEYDARQKAEEALRQAQKMEAVGQLTGGIAHDFNNLLTIVLGGLEAIGRQISHLPKSPAADRVARSKDMAIQGVQRAVTLTNRLLAFSRQQPLAPIGLDANKLVSGIDELLRRTLGERIALESVLAGGLWPTFIDGNQLENALLNLAVNARDAMPDGGKLTIEKAFEPFFTTKAVGRGTGLGLSQVYGFVRQSSGHVRIYSELGEGTTVKLYLPRYSGASQIVQTAVASNAPRAILGECILVVEDDESLRSHAAEMLNELGYRVIEAPSGAAALSVLDSNPGIDLLFTDVVMPGTVNGRSLADEALRKQPQLKVLFTTGYTRNAIVHHGRLDPGIHLLTKPYSFQQLALKVRERLDAEEKKDGGCD